MIVICIIGTLAGIAVPSYRNYIEQAKRVRCISEIKLIERELLSFYIENDTFPDGLDEIGLEAIQDPWKNPYEYLRVDGAGTGELRKDHFMVPVNTDFDLYSKGPDGKSLTPFTANPSRDDIVRANNGQYIGPVSSY